MKVKNRGLWIAAFTIPCMILFALVYAAPIVTVAYTSLCEYTTFSGPVFKGLDNFMIIFKGHQIFCMPYEIHWYGCFCNLPFMWRWDFLWP